MNKFWIVIVFVLGFVLVSCAPDPRDLADARRTDALTNQDVADREQARRLQLAKAQADAADRAAQTQQWNDLNNALMNAAKAAGQIAVFSMIVSFGIGMSIALVGMGRATAEGAMLRANLIPLDTRTRQYPLLRQWKTPDGKFLTRLSGNGIYLLANPNDGSVQLLDKDRAGDRQKIAGMVSAWDTGLIVDAAAHTKLSNSEGVAIAAPASAQIIEASEKFIEIGVDDGKQ